VLVYRIQYFQVYIHTLLLKSPPVNHFTKTVLANRVMEYEVGECENDVVSLFCSSISRTYIFLQNVYKFFSIINDVIVFEYDVILL
jgi:hypothetical protein